MDLKAILFDSVWSKITVLESRKHWEPEPNPNTFWLQSIDTVDCKSQSFSWLEERLMAKSISESQDELIACESWKIKHSSGPVQAFPVRHYQSVNDRFFSMVVPESLMDKLKLYLFFKVFKKKKKKKKKKS